MLNFFPKAEPTIRQPMTLSDQLSLLHSPNLRSKSLTLAAILEADKNSTSTSAAAGGRTLLDVIREEEEDSRGGSSRWSDLTNHLQIRSPSMWTAGSGPTPSSAERSDGPIRVSLSTLMELREEEEEEERAAEALTEVKGQDGDGDVEEGERGHVLVWCCCVCMVRKKGAAFIPCGHTFCRVCSREMMASRGNCPLCNASILEVLDIF